MASEDLKPALELIKKHEGLRLRAYLDGRGIPTIGYGHTYGVRLGDLITKDDALEMLTEDVQKCVDGLKKIVTVPLSNNELCALVSFTYNIGLGAFEQSTMLKKLNLGHPKAEVAAELMRWVHIIGHVSWGLVDRRKDEQALFLS